MWYNALSVSVTLSAGQKIKALAVNGQRWGGD